MDWYGLKSGSDMLSIVSTALAVVGIGLAIYFYVKQKQTRIPRFSLASSQIISREKISSHNLHVTYNGRKIDNLVIAKLAFWNAGNVSMRKSDCAGEKCLQILSTPECKIIDAVILRTSFQENNVTKNFDEQVGSVLINFDFLRPQEGFVLSIAYEGSTVDSPNISQTMIDGATLQQVQNNSIIPSALFMFQKKRRLTSSQRARNQRGFFRFVIFVGILMAIGPIIMAVMNKDYFEMTLSCVGFLYIYVGLSIRPRVPKELQDVYLG